MRYVITGASGHIGVNFVRFLAQKQPNAEIVLLHRRPLSPQPFGGEFLQAVGDLENDDFLRANVRGGDVVVHLAGVIDLTDKKKEECIKVNYGLTKRICDLCREVGVAKFVYAGSVDGIAKDGQGKIFEQPTYEWQKVQGNYGQSKAMAMDYVLSAIESDKTFNAAMVLPSAVIGPNDFKPSAVGKVLLDALQKKPQFGVRGGYNFVDVRDVCQAIYTLATGNARGQFILSGENVSVVEMYRKINEIKGWKKRPIIVPKWLVSLAVPFTKILSKITVKALFEPHDYSYQKAKQQLGYEPRDFDETLKDTLCWFEQNATLFQ